MNLNLTLVLVSFKHVLILSLPPASRGKNASSQDVGTHRCQTHYCLLFLQVSRPNKRATWLTQGRALTCVQEDHMNNVSFQEVI